MRARSQVASTAGVNGGSSPASYGSAWADWDNDGDYVRLRAACARRLNLLQDLMTLKRNEREPPRLRRRACAAALLSRRAC